MIVMQKRKIFDMAKSRMTGMISQVPIVAGVAAIAAFLEFSSPATAQARQAWERIEPAMVLLDGAVPATGSIRLDLPAVTQDGSSVPLTVEVERSMLADDYIVELHLFASGNPSPELAEFRFTLLAGQAQVQTRVRLDRSQTVIALARTSQGEWLAGSQDIRVTVSGCLSRAEGAGAADFMRARVRAPNRAQPGVPGEIRTLINHPMETGLRKDSRGQTIPKRIIREFRAELEGETVLTARFHRAVAANPYLLFFVAPGRSGQLDLRWEEDTGEAVSAMARIPAA